MKIPDFFVLYGHPIELVGKLIRKFWLLAFIALRAPRTNRGKPGKIHLITSQIAQEDLDEIMSRAKFYVPDWKPDLFVRKAEIDLPALLSSDPILIFGPRKRFLDWLVSRRTGTFDVDFRTNPTDGWGWTGLADYLSRDGIDFFAARQCLNERVTALKQEARTRSYIFGTGPSLEAAMDRQWNDGYRIVCNTIVRDPLLWDHLKPDFIVAGDAIYHFGHTSFARAFRRDLRVRLESSNTLFIYPAQFHAVVARELVGLEERLVPIPPGWRRVINIDLTRSFRLPNLGNVLGLLLLPLACTLSKHVFLWGFDGRAPDDKLFWSNSGKHTYAEYMDELKKSHPRFFEHYVPASDPNKYVRDVQGERLDTALRIAERKGWAFEMMHRSWTPTLQKRYHGGE